MWPSTRRRSSCLSERRSKSSSFAPCRPRSRRTPRHRSRREGASTGPLHHRLVDHLHRSSVKTQKKAHHFLRRNLVQLANQMGQRAGHARTSDRQEFHLFRDHLARRTDDTRVGEANHCRMLPPQKVTDLLDLVVKSGKALFSTKAVSKGHLFPFERQNDRSFVCFDVNEAKPGKPRSLVISS